MCIVDPLRVSDMNKSFLIANKLKLIRRDQYNDSIAKCVTMCFVHTQALFHLIINLKRMYLAILKLRLYS